MFLFSELTFALQIDWGDPGSMTESAIDFGDEIDFSMADITVETGGTEEGDEVIKKLYPGLN